MREKLAIIYEPKGAAREYAELALNLYNGCNHGCIYCYNNGRYSKPGDFFKSPKPRMGISSKIAKDARTLIEQYGDKVPEVLISFIGDAYQPAEKTLGITRLAIRVLIDHGIPFTILTKSSLVKRDHDILAPYREKFRLGMTIISANDEEVYRWEPCASHVMDRLQVLRMFKDSGVKTWISLEPVMSPASAIDLIRRYHDLVDFWWIGKLNHMQPPEPVDWAEAMRDIMATLDQHHCKYKFKSSFTDL